MHDGAAFDEKRGAGARSKRDGGPHVREARARDSVPYVPGRSEQVNPRRDLSAKRRCASAATEQRYG